METQTTPPITKKKRVAKPVAPRIPRVVDPAITEINEVARKARQAHRKQGASARILRVIFEKRLTQLTSDDQQKLLDELAKRLTPPLPGV